MCTRALSTVDKHVCFLKTLASLQFSDLHFNILFSEKCNFQKSLISFHWLPVAARIKFKRLMLAYRTTTGSAPPTSTHYYESISPPEVWDLLVSDTSWYHHREAQNHFPEHSRSPFLAGGMIFPPPSGMLDPCQSSSNNWKLISFNTTWLLHKQKKNLLFIFLSFSC